MHRRAFMHLIGGGVVMAATPACVATPRSATSAWSDAGAATDPRLHALSHALLAPNPHNRQPWLARLDGADAITLYVDRQRLLPVTDPFSRQILIGCGAFVELLALATPARGFRAQVTPWPEGEPGDQLDHRPFATVCLAPTGDPADRLFEHVLARRSNKEPYDAQRTPTTAELDGIVRSAVRPGLRFGYVNTPAETAKVRDLVTRAYEREYGTPAALKESVDLMRIGSREIARYRDGIDLGGAPIEIMAATGLITRQKLMTPGTMAHQQGARLYVARARTTNAFLFMGSGDNSRDAQLETGRAYARLNLAATRDGLAMHPLSQALQEFPEMAPLKSEADRLLGVRPDERLQMLVRVGYGRPVPPSPRRGLQAHLMT